MLGRCSFKKATSKQRGFSFVTCPKPFCEQFYLSEPCLGHVSDVLKPLHLDVVFGRKYRFQNVDFSQVAEALRKVRGRGFSIMYSRKLRGRATIQSRKQEIVVFLHARKRKQTSISFLNPRKRRGSDSLFKPLAEGTFHPAQGPRKPSQKGFNISLRPQLGLEHCSCEQVVVRAKQGGSLFAGGFLFLNQPANPAIGHVFPVLLGRASWNASP